MRILVTNDDGILSEGLWALARELKEVGRVTVVAPESEQSAIGTAVTLREPLRLQKVTCSIPGITAYSVGGTPSDSVIMALGRLLENDVDVVVSGINHGSNLGEDVHISGTVGAALQGYLRGLPSLAVSVPWGNEDIMATAAAVAAIIAPRLPGMTRDKIFLNVNLPDVSTPAQITGVRITRLARQSHINTVEEHERGEGTLFRLVRQQLNNVSRDGTDVHAYEQNCISITPLYYSRDEKPARPALEALREELLEMLKGLAA